MMLPCAEIYVHKDDSTKQIVDTIDHMYLSYVKRVDVLAVVSSHVETVVLMTRN